MSLACCIALDSMTERPREFYSSIGPVVSIFLFHYPNINPISPHRTLYKAYIGQLGGLYSGRVRGQSNEVTGPMTHM